MVKRYSGGYKKQLGKIGNFDESPYKNHFQNWQFDVSLLENFQGCAQLAQLCRTKSCDFELWLGELFIGNWPSEISNVRFVPGLFIIRTFPKIF